MKNIKTIFLSVLTIFCIKQMSAQDTILTSCVFYIGATNTFECLNLTNMDPGNFKTINGTINNGKSYSPKDTGICYIGYDKSLYQVKVMLCPNPAIVIQGLENSRAIPINMLLSGKRIIPRLFNFPFDMYISMKACEIALLDKNKNELIYKDQTGNYILFSKENLKKAKYFLIKSASVSMADISELGYSTRKIICNKEYEIVK